MTHARIFKREKPALSTLIFHKVNLTAPRVTQQRAPRNPPTNRASQWGRPAGQEARARAAFMFYEGAAGPFINSCHATSELCSQCSWRSLARRMLMTSPPLVQTGAFQEVSRVMMMPGNWHAMIVYPSSREMIWLITTEDHYQHHKSL